MLNLLLSFFCVICFYGMHFHNVIKSEYGPYYGHDCVKLINELAQKFPEYRFETPSDWILILPIGGLIFACWIYGFNGILRLFWKLYNQSAKLCSLILTVVAALLFLIYWRISKFGVFEVTLEGHTIYSTKNGQLPQIFELSDIIQRKAPGIKLINYFLVFLLTLVVRVGFTKAIEPLGRKLRPIRRR